jgi:hypothetical protein
VSQKLPWRLTATVAALPPKADMKANGPRVRFGPIGDIAGLSLNGIVESSDREADWEKLNVGYYRLLLAFFVVISHADQVIFFSSGYHIGVSAVISFFLLSGFVMTALIQKFVKDGAELSGCA